jgi:hypothetical protein
MLGVFMISHLPRDALIEFVVRRQLLALPITAHGIMCSCNDAYGGSIA